MFRKNGLEDWQDLLLVEVEEPILVRTYLVNPDVRVARVDVLLDHLDMDLGVRSRSDLALGVLHRKRLRCLFEMTRQG